MTQLANNATKRHAISWGVPARDLLREIGLRQRPAVSATDREGAESYTGYRLFMWQVDGTRMSREVLGCSLWVGSRRRPRAWSCRQAGGTAL